MPGIYSNKFCWLTILSVVALMLNDRTQNDSMSITGSPTHTQTPTLTHTNTQPTQTDRQTHKDTHKDTATLNTQNRRTCETFAKHLCHLNNCWPGLPNMEVISIPDQCYPYRSFLSSPQCHNYPATVN